MGGFFSELGNVVKQIGEGAGDFVGGALGFNPHGMPKLEQAHLDAGTNRILDARLNEARADPKETEKNIINQQNLGVENASSLLGGGNVSSPMGDAIAKRQNNQFGTQTEQMRKFDEINAPGTRFSHIASTLGSLRNDAQNAVQFAQAQKLASQNATFARNNAINSILGSVGAGIGAFTGGQGGAVLGQQTGNALSGAFGPTGNLSYLNGGVGR